MTTGFLFPNNFLSPKAVDEAFEWEYRIAKSNNFPVFLYNQEGLSDEDTKLITVQIPDDVDELVMRSWMLTENEYQRIEDALEAQGKVLRTTTGSYLSAHQFPSWYGHVKDVTFPSVIIPINELTDASITHAIEELGDEGHNQNEKYFVKDYVKSRKGDFDASIAENNEDLYEVVHNFVQRQEDDGSLSGGVIIRKFIELDKNIGEQRLWFVKGKLVLQSVHPDSTGFLLYAEQDVEDFASSMEEIANTISNDFITIDVAKAVSGQWYVVEIGDGQVSGLSSSITEKDYKALITALA